MRARSAIGKLSNLVFEAPIGVLQVDRHRIVNATGDTHFGENRDDLVSPRNTNRVDMVDVMGVIGHVRRYKFLYPLQSLVILGGV